MSTQFCIMPRYAARRGRARVVRRRVRSYGIRRPYSTRTRSRILRRRRF